jgi:flagellar protein FlbD
MITVTRLNGTKVMINALLIEMIEEVPDTLITLTTGKKILATESSEQLRTSIEQYLSRIGIIAASIRSEQTEGPSP